MARYTTQFGQEICTPDLQDPRKQHKTAKFMAKAMLTPPQLADYESGKFNIYVVDELGRKHWLMYAAPGKLFGRGS